MKNRSSQKELIDLGPPYYTDEEYDECLDQLGRIGRFLGGNRASLRTFKKMPKFNTILDIGCGGGQFSILLAKQFPEAQILGIDISSTAIAFAQKRFQETMLNNIQFEVCSDPQNQFDVVTATLVCHHLDDKSLIEFLKKSYQIAKNNIIINDLHRHWLAYFGFSLLSKCFFRNRLICHDGLLSIKKSFKKKDWISYLTQAGIPLERCSIKWHWAFRWIVQINASGKQ